ncbi:Rv0361 family membrane protein [Mycolicibacterium sp. CBM1]
MAGPIPPNQRVGAEGQPPAGQPAYSEPYPEEPYGRPGGPAPMGPYPGVYPGALPPPVSYPKPRRRKALWLAALAVVLVLAAIGTVLAIRTDRPTGTAAGTFTDSATKTSIQGYLTALSNGDTETVARNNLCGMYDGVKDRKSDLALARLASDAFRRQFAGAEVSSIDAIVPWSNYQAQVLFTMKVAPSSSARGTRSEEQGVAQVLRQGNQLLVCSYLLRTAAQY